MIHSFEEALKLAKELAGASNQQSAAAYPSGVTQLVGNAVPGPGDADAIRSMQRALSAYDSSVKITGVYDDATAKALQKYGQSALYSEKVADASGKTYTGYGVVNTGNAESPWTTEAERRAANNAWLAAYGLSADKSYNLFDSNYNPIAPSISADGMGGVFNPDGYSSNPYFLQATAGVARDQLAGTALFASDKAIRAAISVNPDRIGSGLYVLPDGSMSSAYSPGALSVAAIRSDVLTARGLPTTTDGFAQGYAAVPAPEYYRPAGAAATPVSSGASVAAGTAATAAGLGSVGRNVYQSYYEQILAQLSVPQLALPQAYSEGQLSQMFSAVLRPRTDQAIARRQEALEEDMGELDADAASRGMGASTFVSSLKERQQSAAERDISSIESEYEAALAQRIYEALSENLDRSLSVQKFNLEQQASAQKTALGLAMDWYEAWLDQQQTASKSKSSGKSYKTLAAAEYEAYVAMLSKAEVGALSQGGGEWKERKAEMVQALGSSGFAALIKKYSK